MTRLIAIAVMGSFLLLFVTGRGRAETLDQALQSVTRDAARQLRRHDVIRVRPGKVAGGAAAAAYLSAAVRRAVEAEGIEWATGAAGWSIDVESEATNRFGERSLVLQVRNEQGDLVEKIERTFRLDDAIDRAVIEGLTFDATSSGTATRLAVLEAMASDSTAVVERTQAEANSRGGSPDVVVRTRDDGGAVIVVDGVRIVVEGIPVGRPGRGPTGRPNPRTRAERDRWERDHRYERR